LRGKEGKGKIKVQSLYGKTQKRLLTKTNPLLCRFVHGKLVKMFSPRARKRNEAAGKRGENDISKNG